jgi:hypothetical protein
MVRCLFFTARSRVQFWVRGRRSTAIPTTSVERVTLVTFNWKVPSLSLGNKPTILRSFIVFCAPVRQLKLICPCVSHEDIWRSVSTDHAFLTSILNTGKWSAISPARYLNLDFTTGKKQWYKAIIFEVYKSRTLQIQNQIHVKSRLKIYYFKTMNNFNLLGAKLIAEGFSFCKT